MISFDELKENPLRGDIFENMIERLYREILTSCAVAVDGGANHGRHTFPLASAAPCGRVFAFEPIPVLCDGLRSRLGAAGLLAASADDPGVIIRQAALSNRQGIAEFRFVDEPSSDPRHPLMNAAFSGLRLGRDMAYKIIDVELTTIDIEIPFSAKVEFIKLDLEGGEYHAMLGAHRVLARDLPVLAFEDGGPSASKLYQYEQNSVPKYLRGLGYELFYVTGQPFTDEDWMARTGLRDETWRPYYTVAARPGRVDTLLPEIAAALLG